MLLFDMGLCNTFPLIVIPALTGIFNDHNMDEALTLTPVQASWLGNSRLKFKKTTFSEGIPLLHKAVIACNSFVSFTNQLKILYLLGD